MKKGIYIAASFLFLCVCLYFLVAAKAAIERTSRERGMRGASPPEKEDVSVRFAGERILYDVRLGSVNLGRATFHYVGGDLLNGRKASLMTFHTQAAGLDDMERIYSDAVTFLPLRIERSVRMWARKEEIVEEYDQQKFVLTVTKQSGSSPQVTSFQKDGQIHNAVMLPFYVRCMPQLAPGWSFVARLPQQDFAITLVGVEEVVVPAGTFTAYHFESVPRKFEIWISADQRRIPVKLIGSGALGYSLLMKRYDR